MSNRRKLPLVLTVVAVLGLGFAVSCKGFFVNPTLTSIAVNPTSPQVNVGQSLQLQAFGTYDDGSRKQIMSGVSWSSSDTSVATVGSATGLLSGVGSGSSTITASAQALSGTASATVIGNVTSISVSPTSGQFKAGSSGQAFTFTGSPGPPQFITADNGGTLTITPSDSNFICNVGTDGQGNPAEVCTAAAVGQSPYTIQMSYPSPSGGTVLSPTVQVIVTP